LPGFSIAGIVRKARGIFERLHAPYTLLSLEEHEPVLRTYLL
jgi:hypothetical protein